MVPMLDEEEFASVQELWRRAFKDRAALVAEFDIDPSEKLNGLFRPMREEYERITGWKDMPQAAIMHHRISIYGPPCAACGKPLRTPRARWCAACGANVASVGRSTAGGMNEARTTDGTSE